MFCTVLTGLNTCSESILPLISCWRLVKRLPTGMGFFPQTGYPQHADELSGVVAVWDRRVSGRRHQWGWVGSSVCSLWTVCCSFRGKSLSFRWDGLKKWQNSIYVNVILVWILELFGVTEQCLRILVLLVHLSVKWYFSFPPHSFHWASLLLLVCELEMLSVQGTRCKPSCPARSPSSVHVWVKFVAW